MKRYEVLVTAGAEQDLEEIHDHVATWVGPEKADDVLDHLMAAAETLATFPERGAYPRELEKLGIRELRQLIFDRYRMIYRVIGRQVLVMIVADGRRDLQALLERRLLHA